MIIKRSIFLQVCLLLILTGCDCQDYESTYNVDEAGSEIEDDSKIDYSKYYSVDTSAPLVGSPQGNAAAESLSVVSPIDFSSFFGTPLEFGASNKEQVAVPKNPFAAQSKTSLSFLTNEEAFPQFFASGSFPVDYFEAAQKDQQQQNSENNFEHGPKYISHNVPGNLDGGYSSEIEKIEPKPLKENTKKKYKDVSKEATSETDTYQTPDYLYEYEPNNKYADYSTGKSSSTVSQQPQAPGYYDKPVPQPTPTPYEKYSFQPSTEETFNKPKYLSELLSTVAPSYGSTATPSFEAQPSDTIPSHLKGKNCRRIQKEIKGKGHERRKREAMNCYVCEDQENKAKYTQCSYAVETEPKNEYSGISERYSTPPKQPDGFRYKRYAEDDSHDPYEYIKKSSQKAYSDAQESKDYEDYKIPDYYSAPERSYSEIQSEKIAKNPGNCHKKESEGMTCTICKDPKTGGNYEQCSYTSEPKEQKYAYVTEKKYDSNDEPEEGSESKAEPQTKEAESEGKKNGLEQPKSTVIPDVSKYSKLEDFKDDEVPDYGGKLEDFKPAATYKANYRGHDKFKLSDEYNPDSAPTEVKKQKSSKREEYNPPGGRGTNRNPKKLVSEDPYDVPKHFAESTVNEKKSDVKGLDPSLYGSSEDNEGVSSNDPYKDIDEYHFKLFPEFSNQESQQSEVVTDNPSAESTRKDVEDVLAEFSKKDRSSCKKAEKNGMTCYLCVDDKGIQHEECMFVSESKPQASHLAYHEVKQLKSPNKEAQPVTDPVPAEVKQQHYVKKVAPAAPTAPTAPTLVAAASEGVETKVKYRPNKNKRRKEKREHKNERPEVPTKHDDPDLLNEEEDEPETPKEFKVGDKEGAYSAETRPVYSKLLGVKLPRYMVEKSEFEKEFDEFSYNG